MDKKVLISLVVTAAVAGSLFYNQPQHPKDQFQNWKAKFPTTWSAEEQVYRRMVFLENLAKIQKHNSDPNQSYKMGINQFTAMTESQFFFSMLTPKPYSADWQHEDIETPVVNANIDWVSKGMVTPVKNQGNCGSCWAFSAVGTLESFALMKGQRVNLSEQQLVDCSRRYGNQGCNGGFNYQGLAYVKDHGITDSSSYPYTAHTQNCKIDGGNFKISQVTTVRGCDALAQAINSRPVGVSVDAEKWSHYSSGIFDNCGKSLDHDVLLVGMTGEYWKIKNSWGTSWGESGFIRLKMGNTCGVCLDKSPYPQ